MDDTATSKYTDDDRYNALFALGRIRDGATREEVEALVAQVTDAEIALLKQTGGL